jgi:parvulin-like peptidyl-prolyl isomerase
MGNQVLAGADFVEVAKRGAEFSAGSDGNIREWPDKTRLVSAQLQREIEGLAPGQMSRTILEDWRGLHIIRVVDRQPACHLPFESVQSEIRDKVRQQRTQEQIQSYLKRLREEIPVWTILDGATDTTISGRPGYPRR